MKTSRLLFNPLSLLLIIAGWLALALPGCDSGSDNPIDNNPIDTSGTDAGLTAADFSPAESCMTCHPDQYDQWSGSRHAYSVQDPLWMAINVAGQSAYVNALDQACMPCHARIGSMSGETPWGGFDVADMSPVSAEGIGCDLCHSISSIHGLENGRYDLNPGEVKYGTIDNPVSTTAHKQEYNSLYPSGEYCGSCHDFVLSNGFPLEAVFREWRDGGLAMTGKTCNDCHMTTYVGKAATQGPDRIVHRHDFIGADVVLTEFPNKPEQLAAVTEMLQNALTVQFGIPDSVTAGSAMEISATVTNDKTGHAVPSGVPFNRQMWLAVVVTDALGDTVYSSGMFDANDDLMDESSDFPERDPDLVNYQAQMLRADSTKTGATWEAAGLDNPAIYPNQTRHETYSVAVPQGTAGPLSVEMKLRFRSFGPSTFRAFGQEDLLPIPIVDMASGLSTVTVLP
ncbi:MAG: multiheme c-type cytochrome [Candidatus Zixiibacteriota bacterium]